ncbi:hypothetical protein YC2023_087628 [Brassica napus]
MSSAFAYQNLHRRMLAKTTVICTFVHVNPKVTPIVQPTPHKTCIRFPVVGQRRRSTFSLDIGEIKLGFAERLGEPVWASLVDSENLQEKKKKEDDY